MKLKVGIVGVFVFFLAFGFFYLRSKNDSINVDGKNYEFVVYDTQSSKVSFSRSDKHPKILEDYPWLGAASLSYGAEFMSEMSEQQLNRYFERPPPNLKANVSKLTSNPEFGGEISVVCVEKYLINSEWYLFVGINRSDFPKGVKYSNFVKRDNRWVFPDVNTDPNGNIVRLIGKINEELHRKSKSANFKIRPLSRL